MDFIKEHQGLFSFFLFVATTLLLFFEFPLGESLGLIYNPFFFSLQSLATPAANLNIALLGGITGVLSVKAALTLGSSLIRHTHATTTIHPNPVDDDEIIEVERNRRNGPREILINFFKDNEAWFTFFVYGSSSTTLFLKLPFEALLPLAPFFSYLGPLALSAASFTVSTMGGILSAGAFRVGMHIVRKHTQTQEPERHPHPLAPAVEEQRGNHRASPRPSVASSVTISQQLPPLHPAGQLRIRADRSSAFLRRLDGVDEASPGERTRRSPSPVDVSLDSPRARVNELQQYPGVFLRRQGSAANLGRQDSEEARTPGERVVRTRSVVSPLTIRVAP